ncbi:hypothetical protein Tco_0865847 [Tanacetum coccineum]
MVVMMLMWWWRGGDKGDNGVDGYVVGVTFGGGGIDEVVVVAMVWRWGWWVMVLRMGDDVGGGGRLLDWPELLEGLFHVDIRRSSSGVKLLGRVVSRDTDFISRLAMRRATNVVYLMSLLPQLHDPQSELLLLRSSQQILVSVLFSEMVKDMEVHFDMTMRRKAVFECLRAPHAQDFLLTITIYKLDQHMSPLEYRTIIKYRLMIPFSVDVICPVCRKACLDSFGEHAVHCKDLPGFKYRHDMVRDVLLTYLGGPGSLSRKKHM